MSRRMVADTSTLPHDTLTRSPLDYRQLDSRKCARVSLHRDRRRALRGDAEKGVFVVAGDRDPQAMAFLNQHRDWLQCESQFRNFARLQRQRVFLQKRMVGNWQSRGRRFVRDTSMKRAQFAFGKVGDFSVFVDVFKVDEERSVCVRRSDEQTQRCTEEERPAWRIRY